MLTCGEVAFTSGDVALTGGEVALRGGDDALTGCEVVLTGGDVALPGGGWVGANTTENNSYQKGFCCISKQMFVIIYSVWDSNNHLQNIRFWMISCLTCCWNRWYVDSEWKVRAGSSSPQRFNYRTGIW